MKSKSLLIGLFIVVFAFLGIGGYRAYTSNKPARILPTFGQDRVDSVDTNGKVVQAHRVHTVPSFSFVNQAGKTVTDKDFDGKIYVTDFFFTTCLGICPKMTDQLERVYKRFQTNEQLLLLSHTVNPKLDSVPVLASYADQRNADASKWHFVTGDKKALYEIARDGYYVTASEGDGGVSDFIHTEKFVLVDKEKRIRGYYDGTDSVEVNKLMTDINLLLAEYAYNSK